MLNNVTLIGKLVEVYQNEGEYFMTLAVEKNFCESDGSIKEVKIPCTLWKGIVDSINEYYHPGQMLQIEGRLETRSIGLVVVGENICFSQKYAKNIRREE